MFPLLCLITIATIILIQSSVLAAVQADVEGVVVGGVTPNILELERGKNRIGDA